MGKDSSIQWTDHTFNGFRGCTKVSAGCTNCYAAAEAVRFPANRGIWGPAGTRIVAAESMWEQPYAWNREADRLGVRHRVFAFSLADVFEAWDGPMLSNKGNPFWWCHGSLSNSPMPSTGLTDGCRLATMDDIRERLFQTIDDTVDLDWLLVTKRVDQVAPTLARLGRKRLPSNVWLGASVEDQAAADLRIPELLKIPASIRFLSVEPMLARIDLSRWLHPFEVSRDESGIDLGCSSGGSDLDWVICGGESGRNARPFDLAWARELRDQCDEADVAFFMKQVGANPQFCTGCESSGWPKDGQISPDGGYSIGPLKLKDSHGGDWDEWPADLRVRRFPGRRMVVS